jgi:hypothetical protein
LTFLPTSSVHQGPTKFNLNQGWYSPTKDRQMQVFLGDR